MWPFTKPQLSTDVLFDIHTYNRYGKETMNPDKFIESLTRKQIKMLNTFSADAHRSDKLEKEIEDEMHQEYIEVIGEMRQKEVEHKLSDTFKEEDHIRTNEDYANYLNNNRDKAMLTADEESRLLKMLSGFNKKENEIHKRLDELEGKSAKEGE